MKHNILVTYFSASGVTAKAARQIAETAQADLFEILPETPYTPADLDWQNKNSRSSQEMTNKGFRPPIAKHLANLENYDTIFLGFPIWWYVAPTIINTFLESYDFTGKTVIPFATSGGSGFGKTMEGLKASCSDKTLWRPGKLLNGASEKAITHWLEELSL